MALGFAAGLYGCAAQTLPAPPLSVSSVLPPPSGAPWSPPSAVETLLAYAERIRGLPAPELAQEIGRLGDPQDSPPGMMQLAIALEASRTPAHGARAQAVLQRVLAHSQAQALHPLARMLLAQQAETRRLEEQLERQNQQSREAHRRIDQLNDRLEALRAVERSLLVKPAAVAAPAIRQRPTP